MKCQDLVVDMTLPFFAHNQLKELGTIEIQEFYSKSMVCFLG